MAMIWPVHCVASWAASPHVCLVTTATYAFCFVVNFHDTLPVQPSFMHVCTTLRWSFRVVDGFRVRVRSRVTINRVIWVVAFRASSANLPSNSYDSAVRSSAWLLLLGLGLGFVSV